MPRRRKRDFQIGEWWVGQISNSPYWYRFRYFPSEQKGKPGRVKRYSLDAETYEEAVEELTDWWIRNHRPQQAQPETVQLVTTLLQYYDDQGQHAADSGRILIAINHLSDYFHGLDIASLTKGQQKAYARHREGQGVAPGTWGRELSVARAGLNWAHSEGLITHVPKITDLPKGGKREGRLTIDQFAAWLAKAEDHAYAVMMVMATTLARPQAAVDLTQFQCDKAARLIDLNPPGREQTKKRRPVVPMARHFLPLLKGGRGSHLVMWRPERPKNSKKVEGKPPLEYRPITAKGAARAAARARDAAGLPKDITLYWIRHTMASELRARGVPHWEVSAFLGHTLPGETDRYAKYDPSYLKKAAQAVDSYLDGLFAHKLLASRG